MAALSALSSWMAQLPSHVEILAVLHELMARSGSDNIATHDRALTAAEAGHLGEDELLAMIRG